MYIVVCVCVCVCVSKCKLKSSVHAVSALSASPLEAAVEQKKGKSPDKSVPKVHTHEYMCCC
jgi:hypothetical protein